MKKTFLLSAALLSSLAMQAQKKKPAAPASKKPAAKTVAAPAVASGYTLMPSGLQYKLISDVPGTNARLGDYIDMHITSKLGDSVLYDSRKMNGGQPVPFQVMAPQFGGDLSEGFTVMSAGDRATFLVSADSMIAKGFQLPGVTPGQGKKVEYIVELVSVKSADQKRAEVMKQVEEQKGKDDAILQAYFKANNVAPIRTPSGLYYTVENQGTGVMPAVGDKAVMNYTGRLLDGKVFDSNIDPQFQHVQPFEFGLGQHQVIAGWDEGIALFPKGTKATLYIPSSLAYGPRAQGPIPSNSVLVFNVEVVDVVKLK